MIARSRGLTRPAPVEENFNSSTSSATKSFIRRIELNNLNIIFYPDDDSGFSQEFESESDWALPKPFVISIRIID
jgi:hypothetical protein